MDDKRRVRTSKLISRVLQHAPESAGLTLEPGGWVFVADLLTGLAKSVTRLTREELEEVVASCEKQRFAFDETGTRIRANQGHSAEVDLQLEEAEPPAELFHGTGHATAIVIQRDGLSKMGRHHVHLSADAATATIVGRRHGRPVVFVVDAAKMRTDGHTFFRSAKRRMACRTRSAEVSSGAITGVQTMPPPIQHTREPDSNAGRAELARAEPYSLRTFTPTQAVLGHSAGVYHWTPEGRRLYDFTSGVLVANLGHNPTRWLKAYSRYMGYDTPAPNRPAPPGFTPAVADEPRTTRSPPSRSARRSGFSRSCARHRAAGAWNR